MYPISLDQLAAEIKKLAAGLNAATYKWLMMVAEFDNRSTWPNGEAESCSAWLVKHGGFKLNAARERLRVAHALKGLPKLSAAMAKGVLSFSKVRAATRTATRVNEDQLLAVALKGTAQDVEAAAQELRHGGGQAKLKKQGKPLTDQQLASRAVTHNWEGDGFLVLKARLPADSGKLVLHAIETAMKADPGATFTARRADALVVLARIFLGLTAENKQTPNSKEHAPNSPLISSGTGSNSGPRHTATSIAA